MVILFLSGLLWFRGHLLPARLHQLCSVWKSQRYVFQNKGANCKGWCFHCNLCKIWIDIIKHFVCVFNSLWWWWGSLCVPSYIFQNSCWHSTCVNGATTSKWIVNLLLNNFLYCERPKWHKYSITSIKSGFTNIRNVCFVLNSRKVNLNVFM